jgi:LPXTG-motif cell wall-anchored protein
VTSTTRDPSTTVDPGEETTTTSEEVAGGSEDTLPYTGAGDMTMGGMAGMLMAAGIGILLLFRRKSDSE